MKQFVKNFLFCAIACLAGIGVFTLSCSAKKTDANTVFAETKKAPYTKSESGASVKLPKDALSVVESMQIVFRSVSDAVLPAVVELDVTETKTRQANPFDDFPFFFFNQNGDKTEEYEQQGLGSGVIVRKSGKTFYVLTNNHVAGSANEISVKLSDGRTFKGKLVGADERKDIALVSFESDDASITVASLGNSDSVHQGDICFAMGTPLGYYSSVTQGIVSATGRSGNGIGNISDFIQTDAAINQGNSGGPLVNIYGEVIGINTWIASQSGGSQGLGFAIPINNIKKAIDSFISGGKITYGWMGITLIDIEDPYKEELKVKGKDGSLVAQVFLDSPAFKAGVHAGDYIISLNGKKVKSSDQLVREVGDIPAGETATFVVLRNGKEVTLRAKVEERKEETVTNNSKLWPGFTAVPLTEDVRKQLKLEDKVKGVLVVNIVSKSPAAVLSLRNGDVITAVNGKDVKNVTEFFEAVSNTSNKEIWFDVLRDGHKISTVKYKI